ncbi:MAG: SCO family protein [Terriglobia bacterium]
MNPRPGRTCGAALLSVVLVCALGCKGMRPNGAVQANTAGHFRMQGMVLGTSASTRQVSIAQDVIRDYMPAMNAVYQVPDPSTLRLLQPGDRIEGEALEPADGGEFQLEHIAIVARPRSAIAPSALPPHQLLPDEAVPDIPLVDQDGKAVDFSRYRGKAILLTFIDSRCTEDCPILTRRFERINTLLKADPRAYAGSHLLSISIDPAYDTPRVLRRYGLGYLNGDAAAFSHWGFVRLTPADLKRLATDFGVVYYQTKDDIDHTMTTALLGPD